MIQLLTYFSYTTGTFGRSLYLNHLYIFFRLNFYLYRNRKLLSITDTELKAMAALAHMGVSNTPRG